MIITRTPFRITLGGGGTDLPSYYEKYGGFIFSFTLNKYMYINVNRPSVDEFIRVNYSESETVSTVKDLKHNIARACLQKFNINKSIEIASMADIPSGSGLGSSSCYTVGLLNALRCLKRTSSTLSELAEEACEVEINMLKKPMGKQDQYLATYGGFLIMDINTNGKVKIRHAKIDIGVLDDLKRNLLVFYTGRQRTNEKILKEQDNSTKNNKKDVLESLHYIKNSGYKILEIVESGNISELGRMFDEHWLRKKKLSSGVTNKYFDLIYESAKNNGALGGKISGAGGGGFFTFYIEENHQGLRDEMAKQGLLELRYDFDFEGTKILANFMNYHSTGSSR